jgi:hypothetical protein
VAGLVVAKAPGHHGQVGLRFGFLIKSEWALAANLPASPERGPERLPGGPDGGEVATTLRLRDDELTAQQLDRVARSEKTSLDEPVVLDSLPAPGLDHAPSVATRVKLVNVPGWRLLEIREMATAEGTVK